MKCGCHSYKNIHLIKLSEKKCLENNKKANKKQKIMSMKVFGSHEGSTSMLKHLVHLLES